MKVAPGKVLAAVFAGVFAVTPALNAQNKGCDVLLDVRVHPRGEAKKPPLEMLLIDAAGRKTGIDRETHSVVKEIPESSFGYEGLDGDVKGEPGPKSAVISVCKPSFSRYTLWIVGLRQGSYDVEVHAANGDREPSDRQVLGVAIRENVVRKYVIQLSDTGVLLTRAHR